MLIKLPDVFCNAGRNIDSLSEAERGDLRQQLRANLTMIIDDYADYTDCIAVSLVEKKVDIKRLKTYCLSLHPGRDEHNLMPLSSRAGNALEGLDNVYDIIGRLRNFTSFLDYHLFEKLIQKFKIDETQEELKYPEKLQQYIEKHTVSEFMEVHPVLNDPKYVDDTKNLVIILNVQQVTCQMREVVNIGQVVPHIMNLDQSQLLIHNIGGGCVTVTFLIPTLVAEHIFSGRIFSQEQIQELQNVSVMMLKCNGYEFDLSSPSGKNKLIILLWYALMMSSLTSLHLFVLSTQSQYS